MLDILGWPRKVHVGFSIYLMGNPNKVFGQPNGVPALELSIFFLSVLGG